MENTIEALKRIGAEVCAARRRMHPRRRRPRRLYPVFFAPPSMLSTSAGSTALALKMCTCEMLVVNHFAGSCEVTIHKGDLKDVPRCLVRTVRGVMKKYPGHILWKSPHAENGACKCTFVKFPFRENGDYIAGLSETIERECKGPMPVYLRFGRFGGFDYFSLIQVWTSGVGPGRSDEPYGPAER